MRRPGLSWQTECLETAPTWTHHASLATPPATHDGWTYGASANHITWPGGDTIRLVVSAEATSPDGLDFSTEGVATLGDSNVTVDQDFPGLVDEGVVKMSVEARIDSLVATGSLSVGGTSIAELTKYTSGHLAFVPAGACAD